MLRYLKEAFWAGPRLPIVGRVPWNALAVGGALILGFGEHAVWLAGLGAETLYLYALATNSRFQNLVDATSLQRLRSSDTDSHDALVRSLPLDGRERLRELDKKIANIDALYGQAGSDSLLFDSNREALQKLSTMYLRLLVGQQNLLAMGSPSGGLAGLGKPPEAAADERQIRGQIAALEKALQSAGGSEPLRDSRKATLALLQQRLRNLGRREESLAEIASDLTRIETQVDLAREDASLKGKPSVVTANLDFVSQLFMDDVPDALPAATADTTIDTPVDSATVTPTITSASAGPEREV